MPKTKPQYFLKKIVNCIISNDPSSIDKILNDIDAETANIVLHELVSVRRYPNLQVFLGTANATVVAIAIAAGFPATTIKHMITTMGDVRTDDKRPLTLLACNKAFYLQQVNSSASEDSCLSYKSLIIQLVLNMVNYSTRQANLSTTTEDILQRYVNAKDD